MSTADGLQVAHDHGKMSAYPHAPVHGSHATEPESQYEKGHVNSNRGSTICGVSRKTFFITTVVATAIVLAAALGGGLGGGLTRSSSSKSSSSAPTSSIVTVTQSPIPASSSSSSATSSSTSSAASSSASSSPWVSDCPGSNNDTYTSLTFSDGGNGAVPSGAANALTFQKRCSSDITTYQNLAEASTPSFNACIDLCASYNFWSNSADCTGVAYDHYGTCWIKYGADNAVTTNPGTDAAVLVQ